jgi:hypothetical protein
MRVHASVIREVDAINRAIFGFSESHNEILYLRILLHSHNGGRTVPRRPRALVSRGMPRRRGYSTGLFPSTDIPRRHK